MSHRTPEEEYLYKQIDRMRKSMSVSAPVVAFGVATLVEGEVEVLTSLVTADSIIRLFPQDEMSSGRLQPVERVPGVSFKIRSLGGSYDTGTVYWEMS